MIAGSRDSSDEWRYWQEDPLGGRRRRASPVAERAAASARGVHHRRGRHGQTGLVPGQGRVFRRDPVGRRASRHGRAGGLPPDAAQRGQVAGHHADRRRNRRGHDPRPRCRRQRLHHEAFPAGRPAGAAARPTIFDARGADSRIFTALIEQGISIRKLGKIGKHQGCLRVTVGTKEMNSKFLLAIRDLLE